MQHLDRLWQFVNAVGKVRDIAQHVRHWAFSVPLPTTLYCHLEGATLIVQQHDKPALHLEAQVFVQGAWRIETDHDAHGVYVVAKRLPLIGELAQLTLIASVPTQTHLALRLEGCTLTLRNITVELAHTWQKETP